MAKNKKSIKEYFALGTISSGWVLKNLPFVLFVSFLALIYIANAHYSEKKVREIQMLQKVDHEKEKMFYQIHLSIISFLFLVPFPCLFGHPFLLSSRPKRILFLPNWNKQPPPGSFSLSPGFLLNTEKWMSLADRAIHFC